MYKVSYDFLINQPNVTRPFPRRWSLGTNLISATVLAKPFNTSPSYCFTQVADGYTELSNWEVGLAMGMCACSEQYGSFTGFSVGFCINKRRLFVTNFSSENNLRMFRLNAPFTPDDDWSIQLKHPQVIFQAQVGNK